MELLADFGVLLELFLADFGGLADFLFDFGVEGSFFGVSFLAGVLFGVADLATFFAGVFLGVNFDGDLLAAGVFINSAMPSKLGVSAV